MLKKFSIITMSALVALSVTSSAHEGDHSHSHDEKTANQDHHHSDVVLDTLEKKASYSNGVRAARTIKSTGLDFDKEAFIAGLEDALGDHGLALTAAEMRNVNSEIAQKRRDEAKRKAEEAKETNLKAAEDFLAENKTKEGVKTTESGLQYKVLEEGDGSSPSASDTVRVHYAGRLLDGTQFDSSYDRGEPSEFGVSRVIKGWTEVLQLMKPGEVVEVYIHPELGYGPTGNRSIPPNALLIFKVELIKVL